MMYKLCRLCSCNENVVDIFDPNLKNRELLRCCILLASGLLIRKDDYISTMVCYRCCEIAVKLHKYRINAITNDKLLKEECGQSYSSPIMDAKKLMKAAAAVDEIVNSSESLRSHIFNNNKSNAPSQPKNITPLHTFEILRNNNSVDKPNSTCDILKVPTNTLHINKHPSITKILSEHKTLQVPEEVLDDNVLPLVALNKNDVDQWFLNHPTTSIPEVVEETNWSLSALSDVSSDGDQILNTHRLRKRTYRRIIIDSESEDEQHVVRKTRKTAPLAAKDLPNSVLSVPAPTIPESNLADITLESIFNDFNRYGINFENSEPPIEIGNDDSAIWGDENAIATDNNPIAIDDNAIDIDDESNDVILVSDDHLNATTNTINETPVIDLEVKSLFEQHYKLDYVPTNISILRTTKGTITLQNMVNQIKLYPVPVELEYSTSQRYHAMFLRTSPKVCNGSKNINFWNYKDCIDIGSPNNKTIEPAASPVLPNKTIVEQPANTVLQSLLRGKQFTVPATTQSSTSNHIQLNNGNLQNVLPNTQSNAPGKSSQSTKIVSSSTVHNPKVAPPLKITLPSLNQKQITTPTSTQSATTSNHIQVNNGNMSNLAPVTQINVMEKRDQPTKTMIPSTVPNNAKVKPPVKKVYVTSLNQKQLTCKQITPTKNIIQLNNGGVYNVVPVSRSNGNNANVHNVKPVNQTSSVEKPSQSTKTVYRPIASNQTIAKPPVNNISVTTLNQKQFNTPVSTQLSTNTHIEPNNLNVCNIVPINQTNTNNTNVYTVVSVSQTNTNNTSVYSVVPVAQSTVNTTSVYNVVPVNQTNVNNTTVYNMVPVTQAYSNNTNMYNVVQVNQTNTNTASGYNMVAVNDTNVPNTTNSYQVNEEMPPLIPITASLITPVSGTSDHTIPLTYNAQTSVNNSSTLKLQLYRTEALGTSNEVVADCSKVENSTEMTVPAQTKMYNWHKVQSTTDTLEDIVQQPPFQKQPVINQHIPVQNGQPRTGVIRVKSLAELIKS